jgi:hypothetical protein
MVLLDWTRMGRQCCLAGVVMEDDGPRVVRPLPARHRGSPVPNIGWSPYLLDGHARWEIFELVRPEPADVEPPHVEDVWVTSLRSRRCSAPADQRQAILRATAAQPGEPLFGVNLTLTAGSAHLQPGTGSRSLATLIVPVDSIQFSASQRGDAVEPDFRVALKATPLASRLLAMKDHQLLLRAERAASDLTGQVAALNQSVRAMGERVAVRLGLTRAFVADSEKGPGRCWLMVDGFFCLTDPQP